MSGEKIALVTGVSSGIGRATAILLSERGFRVFGSTRRPAASNESLGNVEVVQLDVRDDESIHSCVQEVLKNAGRIDALVNNAGYALMGSLEETSIDEAKALFETNFFGVLRMTHTVLPVMRKQGFGELQILVLRLGFCQRRTREFMQPASTPLRVIPNRWTMKSGNLAFASR